MLSFVALLALGAAALTAAAFGAWWWLGHPRDLLESLPSLRRLLRSVRPSAGAPPPRPIRRDDVAARDERPPRRARRN